MIESFGPRPTATSGPAADVRNGYSGETIVHRPSTRILPVEPVDRTAQTGPRPFFAQTYLEQCAAYWPNEPEPPVTRVEYDVPEPQPAAETPAADETGTPGPTVDIRR